MKTTYGYSRYSSASQSDGSIIQTQQDAIERYCIDHGIKLVAHYADLTISSKDAEHRAT